MAVAQLYGLVQVHVLGAIVDQQLRRCHVQIPLELRIAHVKPHAPAALPVKNLDKAYDTAAVASASVAPEILFQREIQRVVQKFRGVAPIVAKDDTWQGDLKDPVPVTGGKKSLVLWPVLDILYCFWKYKTSIQSSDAYRQLWTVICDDRLPLELRDEGVTRLRSKAESGDPHTQLLLGRLYRDSPLLTPDWVEARYWFGQAAHSLPDAQYALGKLLLTDDPEIHDRKQGIRWLTRAAENGNDYAAYRLGKELLKSENIAEALSWLTASAEANNPYAEYLLGKLYWEGEIVFQDKKQAVYWLAQAAEQGHTHAQILLERQDSSSLPSAILAVNSLLHQMGRIFRDNTWPKDSTHGQYTDSKLRRKILGKKIALGHKPDDHEEQGYIGPAM